ncbi:MAG: MBL fold metallo-hydrolase [Luteibaculum sp.]
MRITFLGTGTSAGIPLIGCKCHVCTSTNPKDKRLRSSILIEEGNTCVVVDTTPDFRYQMLSNKVEKLDAVLFTHEHRDHIAGLDDTRPYLFWSGEPMQIYCEESVENAIRRDFYYAFEQNPYPGSPQFALNRLNPNQKLEIGDLQIEPLRVWHGKMAVLGFRINNFAYITDANRIPPESWERLQNLDYLVLNALRIEEHHSHYNLKEALEVVAALNPKNTFFTHISHQLGTQVEIDKGTPPSVQLAYDGLALEI